MSKKYYLIRSPSELLGDGLVGYGWQKVDFSRFSDTGINELLKEIKNIYGSYGRKKNQVQRFFNLKKGDVVVVPMHRSIAIGVVGGEKSYDTKGPNKGANRVSVEFIRNHDSSIRRISTRSNIITNALLSRLRLRQSNASINAFAEEIEQLISLDPAVNNISSALENKISDAEKAFKAKLLSNLRSGKNLWLQGGGDGFEKLICELLEVEGYSTQILSKKSNAGLGDIDIEAVRGDFFKEDATTLAIQVKHHKGETSIKALEQVITAITSGEVDPGAIPMVITTATFNKKTWEKARENDITLIEGEQLVDWLYGNLSKLSSDIQLQLGVMQMPTLLEDL